MDRYIARVTRRDGRKVYETIPFATREEAASVAFAVRPSAKSCSTSRASLVDGRWQDFGFDTRWHDRGRI